MPAEKIKIKSIANKMFSFYPKQNVEKFLSKIEVKEDKMKDLTMKNYVVAQDKTIETIETDSVSQLVFDSGSKSSKGGSIIYQNK